MNKDDVRLFIANMFILICLLGGIYFTSVAITRSWDAFNKTVEESNDEARSE